MKKKDIIEAIEADLNDALASGRKLVAENEELRRQVAELQVQPEPEKDIYFSNAFEAIKEILAYDIQHASNDPTRYQAKTAWSAINTWLTARAKS